MFKLYLTVEGVISLSVEKNPKKCGKMNDISGNPKELLLRVRRAEFQFLHHKDLQITNV